MNTATNPIGYTPQQGSTAWKVIEFLTTNPDEGLSSEDIEAKFDKPAKQVHSLLAQAISSGVLRREEDLTDGELLYRLGSGHPDIRANAGRAPSLHASVDAVAAAFAPTPRSKRYRIVLDVAEIQIEKDVPLPAFQTNGRNRSTDWPALFDRMQPGDSAQLPSKVKATLCKAISRYHKEREGIELATRMVGAEHVRLWRVK